MPKSPRILLYADEAVGRRSNEEKLTKHLSQQPHGTVHDSDSRCLRITKQYFPVAGLIYFTAHRGLHNPYSQGKQKKRVRFAQRESLYFNEFP